jgi:adenine deaminase
LRLLVNHLIDVARGEVPADLLLRGARIANVLTGEIYPANVAIASQWIAGVGKEYAEGKEVLGLSGLIACPGLINGHLHLESSLLTPAEYARLALAHRTTTVILDSHEIAKVRASLPLPVAPDLCRWIRPKSSLPGWRK